MVAIETAVSVQIWQCTLNRTAGRTRYQGPIRWPIRVEIDIFATLNANIIDSDKERQNPSRVTDSTDLHRRIDKKTVQSPMLRQVGYRVPMGFRNGYIGSKPLHSMNYSTERALTMWKEAHLEQNGERD